MTTQHPGLELVTATPDQVADYAGAAKLDPGNPLDMARRHRATCYTADNYPCLIRSQGAYLVWDGARYAEISDEVVQARVWRWMEDGRITPTRRLVAEVLAALQAVAIVPEDLSPPVWLDQDHPAGDHDPDMLVATPSGLLNLETRQIYPASPRYFTRTAIPVSYDPDAAPPRYWLRALGEWYEDDGEVIAMLQECFGYLVSGLTNQHKGLLLIGPRRSGKGTLLRMIRALLGVENVCGPTLSSLSGSFGLEALIARSVALIGDARISTRADWSIVAERILSVTGEDTVTVDRKFRPAWTGRLPTRFVIATNELPRLADASGALASRFLLAVGRRSYFGAEDVDLYDRLVGDLPGILTWALDGLDRLRSRGHFIQPGSSREAIQEIEDLGSPISAFVRGECEIGDTDDHTVRKDHLYGRWGDWCREHGYPRTGSEPQFARDLRAALPTIGTARPRADGERVRVWTGIRLRPRYRDE